MATTRKSSTPITLADLPAAIERIATGPKGTTAIVVDLGTTTDKVVTDRIRRLPRLKGWNAVSVRKVDVADSVITYEITSTGLTATPWPAKKAAPAKPAAKTSKTSKPAAAKKAAKPAAKRSPRKSA